jgi:hypothetical protein
MIQINSHTGSQKFNTCLVGAYNPAKFFSLIFDQGKDVL